MDTDDFDADLRDRLDRSFGDGPTHRPLDGRIAAGHRALFRRRIGTGLVSAAVVVAVVGTSFAIAGGDDRATQRPGYAASDTGVVQAKDGSGVRDATEKELVRFVMGSNVRYSVDGELIVRPGWTVTLFIDNPLGLTAPDRSAGVEVTNGETGERQWALQQWGTTSGGTLTATRDANVGTFEEWLISQGATEVELPWRGEFVRYDAAKEVEVRPGAEVLERIENPYDYKLPKHSDGLTVSWKGKNYWMLLEAGPDGGSAGHTPADPEGAWNNLSEWVTSQVAVDSGSQGGDRAADFPGTNVRFDDTGSLVADEGYRIVEQRTDIDLPDNFAQAGDTTAVALVEGGGERTWWLGRVTDGFPDYIPYAAKPGQTVEEFLTFARGKYDAGVGLR